MFDGLGDPTPALKKTHDRGSEIVKREWVSTRPSEMRLLDVSFLIARNKPSECASFGTFAPKTTRGD
jgi:hypothetical protein